jgi:hypothetical protein
VGLYPFIGLNPENFDDKDDSKDLHDKILNKYFSNYKKNKKNQFNVR